ncbi:MAG: glycosyltransferase family 39 protein [Ardenticatenaceae bacterium]|nr:glycosyltransferase family 39 protein [Ardenticatenaceae bacterium]MCB8946413.1 glycosyltransferase family 39 protein [Ardenticatenaceae bacterium]
MRDATQASKSLILTRLVPVMLLLLMFWAALSSIQVTAGTYDEYEYISRGYTYLKTGNTNLKLRHPVLLDSLAAVPLLLLPDVQLPLDSPALAAGDFHVYARNFMWEANAAIANKIYFLARLPVMALSLLQSTAVFAWTRQKFGTMAGLVALTLVVFDPNWLAHGRLVTPDVGQSTLIFLSVYTWWRYLQKLAWPRLLLAGVVLGLAQTAGFPALILYPILFLITMVHLYQRRKLRALAWPWLLRLVGLGLLSLLTIWAVYGFAWGPLPWLNLSGPAPYHWAEFQDLLARLDRQDLAYLNGEVYRGGKLVFFVVALLFKTPLSVLLLALAGLIALLRRGWLAEISLWLVPAIYYATSLTSSLNIGYRHILPMLPFLYVWGGTAVLVAKQRWQKVVGLALLGWLLVASMSIRPYYLTYFNELAGGPSNGLNHLVVSDLDWGQDLPGLADYLGDQEVYLSYFGTTPPEQFGIRYQPIPAWPPRGIPQQWPYHPDYPLPGTYAISAANLVGARFEENPDTLAWFRRQTPQAVIGNSIYVYEVPRLLNANAPQVNLLLSGLALADVPGEFIADELHTNDVQPRWFDAQQALLLATENGVLLLPGSQPIDPFFQATVLASQTPWQTFTAVSSTNVHAYQLETTAVLPQFLAAQASDRAYTSPVLVPAPDEAQLVTLPVALDTAVSFLGWQIIEPGQPGQTMKVMTVWRFEEAPAQRLAIFMHLLAPDGTILAQFDGLGAASETLRAGDVLIQLHELALPANLPENTRWLNVGMYYPDSLTRLTLPNGAGDRLLLPLTPIEEE